MEEQIPTGDKGQEPIGTRNVFDATPADIPEDAVLIATVRNRPYAFMGIGIGALVFFMIVIPQYWIGLSIAIVLSLAVGFATKDTPVFDAYEGFLVCHRSDDPDKLCIIPNDHIIQWSIVARYNSIIQVYYIDVDDPEQALCASVHTINSYRAQAFLDKYYPEQSLVEIQRENDRKNYEHQREARKAAQSAKLEAWRENRREKRGK